MKKLIWVFILIFSIEAFGFVENVTKGYPNCMACHVSPTGGGILSDYGRVLSAEMMSTWKVSKGFEKPFYGLVNNTKNVKFGGQLRTIQVHAENDQIKVGKKFIMQNNVEFAAKYMEAFLVGTIGTKEGPKGTEEKAKLLSERHFLLWETSPDTKVRIGKFRQHFGIFDPNHTRLVKESLGFGSNTETYNLEVSKFYDWGEINVSHSLGKLLSNEVDDQSKRDFAFNYSHYLEGDSRLGTSLLIGKSKTYKRFVLGLNAVIPIGENGVGRSEVNFEKKKLLNLNNSSNYLPGLYGAHVYGYKFFKGGLGYFVFEHSQSNLEDNDSLILSPGIGLQLLPIPHVEVQLEYQKRRFQNDRENPEHRSFMVFHLYH